MLLNLVRRVRWNVHKKGSRGGFLCVYVYLCAEVGVCLCECERAWVVRLGGMRGMGDGGFNVCRDIGKVRGSREWKRRSAD